MFLISEKEIGEIIEEEKERFRKDILRLINEKIEKICKKNYLPPSRENFLKSFPENYFFILKECFEEDFSTFSISTRILNKIKSNNLPLDIREKEKELEEYFLLSYIENSIENLFLYFKKKILGEETDNLIIKNIRGLKGERIVLEKLKEAEERLNLNIQEREIEKIHEDFKKNLRENFEKIKNRAEIFPLMFFQIASNPLNKRYPHLFQNLEGEKREGLIKKFLKNKKISIFLCYLYSFSKYFYDKGILKEDTKKILDLLDEKSLEEIKKDFFMGFEEELILKIEDLSLPKKGFLFGKLIYEEDFKAIEISEEYFKEDEEFLKILKEEAYLKYEFFVENELLPFLKNNRYAVASFRNLLLSPSYFTHKEYLPLFKLKEKFLEFFELEEIKKPLLSYENEIVEKITEKIFNLKKNFSRIGLEDFKEESLKIFEEIPSKILFWEDYEKLLKIYANEFLHLQKIPAEIIEYFGKLSLNYLSKIINEANFIDMPSDSRPQIELFETIKKAKEKGKILSLSDWFKKPITYEEWQEKLFELELSTPYRDFYNYTKNLLRSKESILLLKKTIEILQKEDYDLSISQKILQEFSFYEEISEVDFFNLILNISNFQIYGQELKENIFPIIPLLSENLKKILREKGFYFEEAELELSRKEEAFLNFLKNLKLSKSINSFLNYLKTSKFTIPSEDKSFWDELFIPIKHYLIQIEPGKGKYFMSLYVSGKKEGPHPFEGHQLKNKLIEKEEEIMWNISVFQSFANFLLDFEEEVFLFEYKEPFLREKYRLKQKKVEKVINFIIEDSKFKLKVNLDKKEIKKIWAKAFAPFYASKNDSEIEKDLRSLLVILKNVLI